ncbi:MAG: sulfate reduction electron transfer complex DsrMKJOP subunit DsrP [Nitrospinota bacterium]
MVREKIKQLVLASHYVWKGGPLFYGWVLLLTTFIAIGVWAYAQQLQHGFILTSIRDQVSWGFYSSNFTFLVGVAAAAVLLVIPAYLYHFKPIKEIAFLGEMMAVTAIIMCILFVTVDLGHPERIWHMLPFAGAPNFPDSILTWDVLVLTGYLVLNGVIFFYVLYKIYCQEDYLSIMPLILLSIPWAFTIHTVTAFLYNGLSGRPFWNASILAPRFLASAFCSGPAAMILIFQIVRRFCKITIEDKAIFKVAELVSYTMGINIFLLGCEVFKEFYSASIHLAPMEYLYHGLNGHDNLVSWMWLATGLNITAFFIFIRPSTRHNFFLLNTGCLFVFIGVYIEKGMGLIIPGFIPGTLGEIYEYSPSNIELWVSLGIWALGALIYTLLVRFAVPIFNGDVRFVKAEAG